MLGQFLIRQNMVDAGTQRDDRLQVLERLHRTGRRAPEHGIGDGFRVGHFIDRIDIPFRHQIAQHLAPPFGLVCGGKGNDNVHGGSFLAQAWDFTCIHDSPGL
ncbi:hypothetical protein D3C71_1694960 [compost metagenome]